MTNVALSSFFLGDTVNLAACNCDLALGQSGGIIVDAGTFDWATPRYAHLKPFHDRVRAFAFVAALRNRVHLVSLPTADIGENAAIVNALQRHASVIVQKSLQEGFGLTVTEGMWKARPVIASAVA